MITSNVWTSVGLSNGATGTCRHKIYAKNMGPPNLPWAIIIEMDESYNGLHLKNKPRHIALNPITAKAQTTTGIELERRQFPLR